jgi:2,3-bisphosphoglycerate-dependent phosphoglycerate mutase
MTTVLLVRHAEPVAPGDPRHAEHDRPLTGRGVRDAEALAARLRDVALDAIYASPYPRAVQTVAPSARLRGLPIGIIPDLRERLLAPDPLPDWRVQLERTWLDFDHAPPGGETSRIAQARGLGVLDRVRADHPTGTVMLGGHGNLIALVLRAFAPRVDFAFWEAIPMPAVYRLEFVRAWRVVSGPGLDEPED